LKDDEDDEAMLDMLDAEQNYIDEGDPSLKTSDEDDDDLNKKTRETHGFYDVEMVIMDGDEDGKHSQNGDDFMGGAQIIGEDGDMDEEEDEDKKIEKIAESYARRPTERTGRK
jgi:hypothetical protein